MTRILIVDDHAVVRHGVQRILQSAFPQAEFAEAQAAPQAFEHLHQRSWNLVILDISMPGRGGLDILMELKRLWPKIPVLIMSVYPEEQYAKRVLKSGAAGYVTKDAAPEEFIKAVKKVLSGGRYVSQSFAESLAFSLGADTEAPPHQALSNRELQVLKILASGKTVNQIAEELALSPQTISTYRARILEKMRMKTNAELIRYAVQNHLVD